MKRKGSIFVISAASGTGKTTLLKALMSRTEGLGFSVSYTTRKPREGEVQDIDYTFVDEAAFRRMAQDGEFAEWAEVHGNLYGTSRARLLAMVHAGKNVLLDIDVEGTRQIMGVFDDAVFIFIMPPSMEVLRARLQGRMSDSREDIERRLKRAADEMREYLIYDYVIINDALEDALKELEAVVIAVGLRSGSLDPSWVKRNILKEEVY